MRFRHRDILMFEARVPGTSVRQAGAHDPANEDPALSLSFSLSLSLCLESHVPGLQPRMALTF